MTKSVRDEVKDAIDQAEADPHPDLDSRFEDALAEKYPLVF